MAGVRCAGRGRKTWYECVKDDMMVLGLHPEWAVFRDMWRGFISGGTSNPSWAWRNGRFKNKWWWWWIIHSFNRPNLIKPFIESVVLDYRCKLWMVNKWVLMAHSWEALFVWYQICHSLVITDNFFCCDNCLFSLSWVSLKTVLHRNWQ